MYHRSDLITVVIYALNIRFSYKANFLMLGIPQMYNDDA
jgi:hypothetical protein